MISKEYFGWINLYFRNIAVNNNVLRVIIHEVIVEGQAVNIGVKRSFAQGFVLFIKFERKCSAMASIREIKKEVNESLALFIDDCYEKRATVAKDISADTEKLVDKAITLFDELIHAINHPDDQAPASAHFKEVQNRFENGLTELYKSLSELG